MNRNYVRRVNKTSSSLDDNYRKFVKCWNIYAGIFYESDGETNRRMDAIKTHAEMVIMLGGETIEIYPGVKVKPDYFPVEGSDLEFDWIMGFSLMFLGKPVGRINSIVHRGRKLIISTEYMTLGFDKRWEEYAEEEIPS